MHNHKLIFLKINSKNEIELTYQLFSKKFKDKHLIYSKLNYSEWQEFYNIQKVLYRNQIFINDSNSILIQY